MKTEEDIRKECEKRIKYICKEKEHNKVITDCAWYNALRWVLEDDNEVD